MQEDPTRSTIGPGPGAGATALMGAELGVMVFYPLAIGAFIGYLVDGGRGALIGGTLGFAAQQSRILPAPAQLFGGGAGWAG